ncbi:MAG: DUF2007 domain-containing protein [bacterium]|nr:DUF2007 domain-containing protein [bacterium]MDE0241861.1 DUF2007 domain-containing protein [bacterium]MDE0418123.1 DUF2007 domain-containing protein [bacterium]
MKEILRTNDVVTLSWASAVLKDADVFHHVFDQHTSSLQGSILAIEKRLLVSDDDESLARDLLRDAGVDVRGD